MYIGEQRKMASGAWKILKKAGMDARAIGIFHKIVKEDGQEANSTYTRAIRKFLQKKAYDGIEYQNEYECSEGENPTCYIVFDPSQVKSLEPQYGKDGQLVELSRRFDVSCKKFTH